MLCLAKREKKAQKLSHNKERERVLDFLFCLIVPSWLSQSQAACKKGNYLLRKVVRSFLRSALLLLSNLPGGQCKLARSLPSPNVGDAEAGALSEGLAAASKTV